MNKKSQKFLDEYLSSLDKNKCKKYTSFSSEYFCSDEESANYCSGLVFKRIKTATCSMKLSYKFYKESLPQKGHLMVVTDWDGVPTSIIETVSIKECKYCDVDAEFAFLEGEGDRSLAYWQKAHWQFFSQECEVIGMKASGDMLLVLEVFKRVK